MRMKHLLASLGVLALVTGAAAAPFARAQPAAPANAATIAQGKYLAAAGDCAACHTAQGGAPFAGGVVIDTGFGKLVGPNITPDKATGIGSWSNAAFVRSVKYGVGHDGAHLYPGMPYVYYTKVPAQDILKIRAYLNTIPAVDHRVQANQLPFPFSIRFLMNGWNWLNFPDHGDYRNDPSQSAEWNRGAYLVQGLGHCAACHTPKTFIGGDRTAQAFTGYVVDGMNAPALVDRQNDGLGGWSADDIAAYLKTGHNRFADAAGPMMSVITHSTSQLTDADDHAMAVYLKSLQPRGEDARQALSPSDPRMVAGAHIYADECAACHTSDGAGQPNIVPALAGSPVVTAPVPATVIRVILNGGEAVSTPARTGQAMPAFRGILDDQQIADVASYIRNSFGNAAPAVTAQTVSSRK